MENKTGFEKFVGREVKIYPGDTHKKRGILEKVDEYGFTFKITYAEDRSDYRVGETVFINHSCRMVLVLHEK